MDLYLIRHADAAPLGDSGIVDDADRPLTPAGETQSADIAAAFQARAVPLHVIVTSPLLRARQTAEGIIRAWPAPAPELRIWDDLAPGGKRRRLTRFVKELGTEAAALVGHQPDLGFYAAWLIGSKRAQVDIAKAGIARIVCDDKPGKGRGTLTWLITPQWFGA